jgi:hypothetical protein
MKLDSNIKRFSNQGVLCVVFCVLFSLVSAGQVASSIDSTAIKIGEELRYRIQVDVDCHKVYTATVVLVGLKIDTTRRCVK